MAEAESYSPLSLRERINLLKRKPTLSNIDIDDDKVPDWSEYNSNKSTSSTNKSKLKGSGIGGIADKNSLDKNSKIRRTDSGVKTDESVKLVLDHLSDNGVNESRPPLENMCDQDNDSDDTDDNVTLSSCVQSKLDKSSGNIDSCYTRIKGSHQVLNREMTSSCFPAENIDVDDNELPVVLSNYYRNRSQSNVLHLSDESISTHNIRMFNEDITYENRFKEQNTGTAIERQKV